jgi:dCTP deaminase
MIKKDLLVRLGKNDPTGLWIAPMLDDTQIGDLTVDLRLSYDFLVSIVTRRPYIGITRDDERFRAISSYFEPTRRELGEHLSCIQIRSCLRRHSNTSRCRGTAMPMS